MSWVISTSEILFGQIDSTNTVLLSVSEGAKLVELISDHELEQVVHFPTRRQNTLDLIITSLPGQFVDIHSPDRLSDHDIVSGTLKIVIPPPHQET